MSGLDDMRHCKVLITSLRKEGEKSKKLSSVAAKLLWASLFLSLPQVVYADAMATSTISFSNLVITSTGKIQFQNPWDAQAFAQAQNSLGGLDSEFASKSGGNATISAAVPLASASGNAAVAPLGGGASSQAIIPGDLNAQSLSTGTGTLFNSFEITGGTGTVAVTFSVNLAGNLLVMTDPLGLLAQTETIFALQLDGAPILPFSSSLTVGPSSSASMTFGPTLSTTLPLKFGTPYSLVAQADSESQAINIPEPPTASLLLTGLLAALLRTAAGVRKRRTQTV